MEQNQPFQTPTVFSWLPIFHCLLWLGFSPQAATPDASAILQGPERIQIGVLLHRYVMEWLKSTTS